MKVLTSAVAVLAAFPIAAHAQIVLRIPSLERPTATATLGGISVSASLGRSGIDLRVDDGRVASTTTRRRTPSSTGRTSTPTRRPSSPTTTGSTRATAAGVLATANTYLGTPYVWGGTTPSGFDCSGFVQYVFRRHGVELPRTSRQQALVGTRVAALVQVLRPGDLMLFATNGVRIDHIAIYAGQNRIIHSSASGGGVGYDDLSTKRGRWFVDHHVASRRVLANGESLVRNLEAALRAFTELDPPDRAPRR